MQLVTVLLYEVYYFADDHPNLAELSIFGATKRIQVCRWRGTSVQRGLTARFLIGYFIRHSFGLIKMLV